MSKRNLVATVVGIHVCVLFTAALIGGCAKEKKKGALATVRPVEEISAPESAPESILEPEGLVEEAELLVARAPEVIPTAPDVPAAEQPEEEAEVVAMAERREEPAEKAPIIPRLRPPAERAAPVAEAKAHTVAPGESLWKISRMYDTTVAELAEANDLDPGAVLRIGQVLVIPGGSVAETAEIEKEPEGEARAERAEAEGEGYAKHTVRKGESLWSIAKDYGIDLKEIVELNKIEDPSRIRVGQVLLIPR